MTDHVEFNLIPRDLADAATAMRPRNWGRYERLRLVLGGACIALSVYISFVAYLWRQHGIFLLGWEDALAFAFAGAVLGWLYGRLFANPAEDDPRLMERSFVLREEGFATGGRGFRTEIDWTSVSEIVDRGGVILLVTEWREAFFIPKRGFATPGAAADFLKRARALHAARWDRFGTGAAQDRLSRGRHEVAWRPERSDLAAFAGLKREITGWRKVFLFAPFVLAGAVIAFMGDEYPALGAYIDGNGAATIAAVAIVGGVLFLLVLFVQRILRALRIRGMPMPAGEMRLVAEAAGLTLTAEGKKTYYRWKDVPAVTLGVNHVFLATARDRAIIVPRRAFPSRPAFLALANFAEEASKHAEA